MQAYTYIEKGKFSLIEEAYRIFENKEDGVIKIAIYNEWHA